jgi:hypothetical protein
VYCGKNSKRKRRGLSENAYVIEAEMDVIDLNPSDSENTERLKLKSIEGKMLANKQQVDDSIKVIQCVMYRVH